MISIEAIIQRKVDVTELQELQKKVEENENKIKELMENSNEVKTWADIIDTTIEENSWRSYSKVTHLIPNAKFQQITMQKN